MNATLSLHNREPSLTEQLRRFEAFENALKQIAVLEQERDAAIDAVITKLQLQDGDVLQVPDDSFPLLDQLVKAVTDMRISNVLFIVGDINHLDEEARRTLAEPYISHLTNAQQQLKDAETEIKRLRALDPDRLKIQVKRLQKEKAKAAAGAQELRTKNQQLTKQNRQLNIALDKAIADVNAGMELKPAQIFEQARLGRWELFTCAKDGWYQILDTENEVSQTVRVEAGNLVTPKIRPVPKAIATEIMKFHQEYFGGAA